MFISASLTQDYVLIPRGDEFRPFFRIFKDQVKQTYQGYSFTVYDTVPDFVVEGASYFATEVEALLGLGAVAEETRSFDTKQAALHYLKRGISIGDQRILDVSKGLRVPAPAHINATQLGIVINHIPQLMELYKGKQVLIGFAGEYSFKSKLFRGQADFVEYGELWND